MESYPEFEEAVGKIRKLTGKKYIKLLSRGNEAIMWALEIMSARGRSKVLIQDQGGWLTYLSYPKKFGFEIVKLRTSHGKIDIDDLQEKADNDSALLINSMPGYFVCEDMKKICSECKKRGTLVINDVSGSIGTPQAKCGEIVLGSFGRWKPVWVGHGGFIATNEKWFSESMNHTFNKREYKKLIVALDGLGGQRKYLEAVSRGIKKDLSDFNVIHRDECGFNIAVKFSDDKEKEKIEKYCRKNNLDCTMCPRYIRLNEPAVCIEIKRKKQR